MRVLICGDRHWTNKEIIRAHIPEGTTHIIEGAATGADTLAGELADELGIEKVPFPAPWEEYRKLFPYPMCLKAGTDRNTIMLAEGNPDLVLAFHNDLKNSKGTKDMVNQAKEEGIPVILYSEAGETWHWHPPEPMF